MNLEVTPERVERGFASRWDAPRVQPPLLRGPGPHFRFDRRDGPRGDEWFDLHREFAGPGRGRLGIVAQPLTGQLAEYFGTKDGVLVSSVREDSPAARAGLRAGDVITSVDGEPVESPSALARAAAQAKEGELTIAYVRDRKSAEAKVRLPARERREGSRPV
jgi:membrane-associated protease RseP (regulator of RpoE activity)